MSEKTTGRTYRPMPDDFAAVASIKSRDELCHIYHAGKKTVQRWRDELEGIMPGSVRKPARLPDNIDELAKGQTISGLAALLGMHGATLWGVLKRDRPDLFAVCREAGKHARAMQAIKAAGHATFERPADFDDAASTMSATQTAAHYGVGVKTVRKWLATSPQWVLDGMAKAAKERSRAGAINSARAQVRAARKQPNKGGTGFALRYLGDKVQEPPILSREKQAMRYLQRFGPCFPNSVYNKALEGYRFKGIKMTGAQIIAEAEKRGWNPDAWREIVQERAA